MANVNVCTRNSANTKAVQQIDANFDVKGWVLNIRVGSDLHKSVWELKIPVGSDLHQPVSGSLRKMEFGSDRRQPVSCR